MGEELTKGKVIELDAQGFNENHEAAQLGGQLTGELVARVESTGRKVVSRDNYLGLKGGEVAHELPAEE